MSFKIIKTWYLLINLKWYYDQKVVSFFLPYVSLGFDRWPLLMFKTDG